MSVTPTHSPVLYEYCLLSIQQRVQLPATVSRSKKRSNVAKKKTTQRSKQRQLESLNHLILHKTNFTCSAREQTRKWRLKLTLLRLQTWSLTALGEGMKILCIKDHVRSSIIDFRERIRAITNPSFAVGRLN